MSTPLLPPTTPVPLTFGAADGALMPHAGRYARECVLIAFEMIGGVERMAHWANANPEAFYTKLFAKTITRETEVSAGTGVEDLLARLDAHPPPHPPPVVLEAEIE